jgi:nitrogen fixation protein NifQ
MASDVTQPTYDWLMDGGKTGTPERGDAFDRHVIACAVAAALSPPERSLAVGLGLPADWLANLIDAFVPHASSLVEPADEQSSLPAAPEEPDLRALLIEHRSSGRIEELWLSHIIARRSLGNNHLWQDLGLTCRADLSQLMQRHFRGLALLNHRDMKWKKFFYRQLCQREGVLICKSPNCDVCTDFSLCFGEEKEFPQ